MSEDKAESGPTLVEKWIKDQQEWQKTTMEYFDSMVRNDEFLTHLGNAMRGSLLAGKPYPGTETPEGQDEVAAVNNRIDEILHTLHQLQGELADLKFDVEDLKTRPDPRPVPAQPAAVQAMRVKAVPPDPAPGDSERGR
jgi:hypothetical protein